MHNLEKVTAQGLRQETQGTRVRPRIVWDESNLEENERNKSATMKIEEPKTPFERSLPESSDDEGEYEISERRKRREVVIDPEALVAALEESRPCAREGTTNNDKHSLPLSTPLRSLHESITNTRTEEEKEAFRQRRKQHYMMRDQLDKQRADCARSDGESERSDDD